ncbi:NAD(P)H-binding protein [Erythrobacter rubeus]|uniref:Divinyl chlorophyllide a 8-vinyl-reductase, chloroplastic n=1 Tax=Erythrobacter rubeus TaxID=2760803 RepID=A0ABR8KNT6_9SPHN|nr:NAD(P)H-binding protein [Erythrobacter rubeus]MBD2840823.1 NAD(P)H-binding protein [Erythrobacter rubeus]
MTEEDGTQRIRILVAGASGTIGRAVVRALVEGGHDAVCLLRRSVSGEEAARECAASGAGVLFADFGKLEALREAVREAAPQCVVSCLASRSGSPKDTRAVDYRANVNLLRAAEHAEAEHFLLLSAICVQKPRLAFQHAKLDFEKELVESALDHTIVRPTAFFKSLSGQVARVAKGKPFLLFGDGELTRCKPISDRDLARFIANCVSDQEKRNQILPIGGPGPAISPREQGEMLFALTGKEPRYRSISPALFDLAARVLSAGSPFSDWLAEKTEYARIAKYYATESMLVLDPVTGEYSAAATPEFGSDTLRARYEQMLAETS